MSEILHCPKAVLLSLTKFTKPADVEWQTDSDQDDQQLIEFAGRECYSSFSNPSGRNNQEYIENMLNLGHLSVIEHATATFRISGISRACSHELVRHRHFSFSQLSQRYVPHDGVKFIEPDAIACEPQAHEVFERAIGQAQEAYDQILEIMTRKFEDVENRTMRRKMARQAARMVLPNATETRMVISANFRALRHFFRMRCTEFADPEIRSLAIQMLKIVREEAPAVFGDYKITPTPEGYEVAETIHTFD